MSFVLLLDGSDIAVKIPDNVFLSEMRNKNNLKHYVQFAVHAQSCSSSFTLVQVLILILLMTLEGPVYMLQLLEGEYRIVLSNIIFIINC